MPRGFEERKFQIEEKSKSKYNVCLMCMRYSNSSVDEQSKAKRKNRKTCQKSKPKVDGDKGGTVEVVWNGQYLKVF